MTATAATAIAVLAALAAAGAAIAGITVLGRYPGTTGLRNSAEQGGAAGPAVRATASRREPGRRVPVPTGRERGAGRAGTWAAR
jgi:hypothetical protein